jgi:RNA polymerase sigma factor (sigma-70 family)
MMRTEAMPVPKQNDVELVAKSLNGSEDAFRQIVERYQNLICSLAYCATGSLHQSEDLAQETFVTAWKELPKLREPSKLRSWLCGILRFAIGKQLRRQGREPAHAAEPMEAIDESRSPEPQPLEQAISNEELAILWRSLEKIPENYREPLVLFYREHQSIEEVAQNLELSEDAVKQRLSRGRKLLHEEVLAFVEGALEKTAPGQIFTVGVLAALSFTAKSAKAATIGVTAAKAGAATKAGVTLGAAGGFLPILGGGYFAFKSDLERAKSPREREFMMWFFWIQIACFLTLTVLLTELLISHSWGHDGKVRWAVFFFAPLVLVFALGKYARYGRRQIQMEDGTWVEPMTPEGRKEQFAELCRMTPEGRKEHIAKQRGKGSKGRMYLYLGMACNMGGLAIMELVHVWKGDRGHLLFLASLSGFTLYLAVCAWRNRSSKLGR